MKKKQKILSRFEKWVVNPASKIHGRKHLDKEVLKILLENRGIKTAKETKEFLSPQHPQDIKIDELEINEKLLDGGVKRIIKALKKKEKIIIFGDYDVDGITSSAILWEFLYGLGADITPYIPERFSEGYGIKVESILKLKKQYPSLSLIITVDNGIVAFDAINKAANLGIDTIVVDHHEKREKYPDAFSVIYTKKLCGAGISWILVREIYRKLKIRSSKSKVDKLLELAALGTVADQIPLVGPNRAIVKYGLEQLNKTDRIGLNALYETSGILKGGIGVYEINYILAPRLNAMGRLENAIESLRLLCTKNREKAAKLAELLSKTNVKRQKIVDEVLFNTKKTLGKKDLGKIIILEDESYHEGVIGLAASKLVDEFGRPAIVISKGDDLSKGSARSIPGFNIYEAIKYSSELLMGSGGHAMAAGFTLKSKNLRKFKKKLEEYSSKKMNKDLFVKKIKIDLQVNFTDLSRELMGLIKKMEPFGIGNPVPTFITKECKILTVKKVGGSGNHIKFKLGERGKMFDAISFNNINPEMIFFPGTDLDVAYSLEENLWNGLTNMQLKIKDLRS